LITLKTHFHQVNLSLHEILGKEYIEAVCAARAALAGGTTASLRAAAVRKVALFPDSFHRRLIALLPRVGQRLTRGLGASARGATSADFAAHAHPDGAPLSAMGYYRLGENGRLGLSTKSEHYHVPLGHRFPGYELLALARRLGIPNAAHNNMRGHITRSLEEELIRTAAGLPLGERDGIRRTLSSKSRTVLNRVLNLETGSLAAEAAVKLLLARFYRPESISPKPKYEGRRPVFVVIGDKDGELQANYHGTTVLTQMMRGMWPGLLGRLEKDSALAVRCVRPNSLEDLERVLRHHETARDKVAGLFHEFLMMNYGAKRLTKQFIRKAYALCRKHDVPTVVDEIQTCVWSPEMFMFREYGVKPSIVIVGKGLPGGEYAASRALFTSTMDTLPQFGALVTNGQEEIASLAYLVTMRWAEANADVTAAVGKQYEERVRALAHGHREHVSAVEGRRHCLGVEFHELRTAQAFAACLNEAGLDISVQTYKTGCPPSALTKLPLIADFEVVDFVVARVEEALGRLSERQS